MITHSLVASRRLLLSCALLGINALLPTHAAEPAAANVAAAIAKNPELSTLNGLINRAGLAEALQGAGPFTVFAPSNEAFKAVPAKTLDELNANPEKLKEVLGYHVLPVKALAADVKNSKAKTLQGSELELSKAGDFVTVESAAVTQADLLAGNGVVHIVDTVLMPPVKK